ncbi:MAG: zf-TFIIB domain-containing protein [Phycisphaerales bacterium]
MSDGLVSCPKDGETMSRITLGTVAIDRCSTCGGVWLDKGELDGIRKAALDHKETLDALDSLGTTESGDRPQPLECPRDHARMSVHHHPTQHHIEFDSCTKCGGMFFDAGELGDLTELTLGERLKALLG